MRILSYKSVIVKLWFQELPAKSGRFYGAAVDSGPHSQFSAVAGRVNCCRVRSGVGFAPRLAD
jgi:hypothetical protein